MSSVRVDKSAIPRKIGRVAEVAEMADALRSGRSGRKAVGVQLPASALVDAQRQFEGFPDIQTGPCGPVILFEMEVDNESALHSTRGLAPGQALHFLDACEIEVAQDGMLEAGGSRREA